MLALVLLALRGDALERKGAAMAGIVGGAAVLLPLALALIGADYIDRNLLSALVPLALIVAAGFGARRAGAGGVAAAGTLCALCVTVVALVAVDTRLQRHDWRSAADLIARSGREQAVVTPRWGFQAFKLYLGAGQRDLRASWPSAEPTPPGVVRVSDVVVVTLTNVPVPSPQLDGFRVMEQRSLGHLAVARLHSDHVRRMSQVTLAAIPTGDDEVRTFVQDSP